MQVKRSHINHELRGDALGVLLAVAFAALLACGAFSLVAPAYADEPNGTAANEQSNDQGEQSGEQTGESADQMQSVETKGNTVNVNQMPDSSFLYNTDIAELFDAESFHDTQMVQVRGEVVGDCIADETNPAMCWITLQSLDEDTSAVVTVLMSREQAALIDGYGNYRVTGTELQVRGIYYLSCPEHQGLSDIHAQEVTVVANATDRDYKGHPSTIWAAVLACGLGILLLFVYRYMRERSK